MTTVQKIVLFLIIIITPSLYLLLNSSDIEKKEKAMSLKPVEIKPIKIPAIEIEKKAQRPEDLLSQLKVATRESKVGITKDKEEVSKLILNALKERVIKQEIQRVETISIVEPTQKEKKSEPKLVRKKKIEKKRVTKKRITKKRVTKNKHVPKRAKVMKRKKVVKKIKLAQKRKSIKKRKVLQKHKSIKREKVASKTKVSHTNKKVLNTKVHTPLAKTFIPKNQRHKLSRAEEVALYERQHASSLEVVGVSKPFEIKEKLGTPDAQYFEPIKVRKENHQNAPLKFVKKLGVVAVSNKYETHFAVPAKKELAKEGIVSIPTATVETEELKKLKFVKPLEVIEVSKEFETIEADKYLH